MSKHWSNGNDEPRPLLPLAPSANPLISRVREKMDPCPPSCVDGCERCGVSDDVWVFDALAELQVFREHEDRITPVVMEALGAAAEALALPTSPAGKERALAKVRGALAKMRGES